jgi:NAD(P)-dependent dehydrogenase (short-subunit alcohol dehydrogenase family)
MNAFAEEQFGAIDIVVNVAGISVFKHYLKLMFNSSSCDLAQMSQVAIAGKRM